MTIDINLITPKFRKVALLQDPQIPGPLGGINPRTILGDAWWDVVRREAYQENNYFCHACGKSPDDDPIHQTLDAHERYDIDWMKGTAYYTSTVALCRSCHSFIHAGRTYVVMNTEQVRYVLRRGMDLLLQENLLPYWRTYVIVLEVLNGMLPGDAVEKVRSLDLIPPGDIFRLPDHRWSMVVNGHAYRRDEDGKINLVDMEE